MSQPLNLVVSRRHKELLYETEGWIVFENPETLILELQDKAETYQDALIVLDQQIEQCESCIEKILKVFASKPLSPRVIQAQDRLSLELEMQKYFEADGWTRHPQVFRDLLTERKSDLLKLRENLKIKLEKKQKSSEENRKRLYVASQRQDLIKKCLIALQEADSTEKIEESFLKYLSSPFELSWVRILPQPEDENFCADLEQRIPATYLRLPLFGGSNEFGSIILVKIAKIEFAKEQIQFFKQLSEAVSMAIVRLRHFENTVHLQTQWEATFNAIPFPLMLMNSQFEIIQSNQKSSLPPGRKCYEELFQRTSPCEHCHRGKKFLLDTGTKTFEVLSQEVINEEHSSPTYVNAYIDITEKSRIQKKIMETSKLAEIGLIGGSIAHEINNPLGGLLSYIQLIRMDLPPEDPRIHDILELEKATQRCIQIVKNLLEVSRDPGPV